jgi:hypothetical protein
VLAGRLSSRRQPVETVVAVVSLVIRIPDDGGSRFGLLSGPLGWARFHRYEREASDQLNGNLNIEFRPIQSVRTELYHVFEDRQRGRSKLRKIHKRDKELAIVGQEPEPICRDMGDIDSQKGFVPDNGFHHTAPGSQGTITLGHAGS